MHEIILPTPNPPFVWRQSDWGPALVCRGIEPFARHLFTTRHWAFGVGSPNPRSPIELMAQKSSRTAMRGKQSGIPVPGSGWQDIAEAVEVDVERLVQAKQVHGRQVLVADRGHEPAPAADIIVTRDPGRAIAVRAADCASLLIVDRATRAVAAAHAGWRGMALRVPLAAVEALAREYGSRPRDLMVAVGPSIGACCYEVGSEVRETFEDASFTNDQIGRWFLERPVRDDRNPPFRDIAAPPGREHWFFDGWAALREQLVEAGMPATQIFMAELCTASHRDAFWSFRRDGPPAGRLIGVIRPELPRP